MVRILDAQGNTVVKYAYDPWAVPTIEGDADLAAINPCSYRGYYYDEETGYYYLQSRYYDPEIGRFINADDFNVLAYKRHVLVNNIFSYCYNCAPNYEDQNGYWAQHYSGFVRTDYGFNVNYSGMFLNKSFCVLYATDVIACFGRWHWLYGYSYLNMRATRIAKEIYAHAVLYAIGMGLLVSSAVHNVLNAIIVRFAGRHVLRTLTTISQKINYIQNRLGMYLFVHSKVINVNNNEKWYRMIVFDIIWRYM